MNTKEMLKECRFLAKKQGLTVKNQCVVNGKTRYLLVKRNSIFQLYPISTNPDVVATMLSLDMLYQNLLLGVTK